MATAPAHDQVTFHRIDPARDGERVRQFLSSIDPEDYLLDELSEWIQDGRFWAVVEKGSWVAFGRLHDLGDGQGWLSGARVVTELRGEGLGAILIEKIIADATSIGVGALRMVIEDENVASRRLAVRNGFRAVFPLTVRVGGTRRTPAVRWHCAASQEGPDGSVGWLPAAARLVDLLPGSDGGRFGAWRASVVRRWAIEGKLYLGPGLAVGVQTDWRTNPRTLWASPLRGDPGSLLPALGELTLSLGHEEWQAFLPSTEELRTEYDRNGVKSNPHWGDRAQLYERAALPSGSRVVVGQEHPSHHST